MFGAQSGIPIQGPKWDELTRKDFAARLEAINNEPSVSSCSRSTRT